MYATPTTASFTWGASASVDYLVNYNASASTCADICTYTWSTGETGTTASHQFASAATTTVTLTVTGSDRSDSKSLAVTPQYVAATPTNVVITSAPVSGPNVTLNYTLSGGIAPYTVKIVWGDGNIVTTPSVPAGAQSVVHNYLNPGTYTVTLNVSDTGSPVGSNVTSKSTSTTVTVGSSVLTISGLVTRPSGTPVYQAAVTLKLNGVTKKMAYTAANGTYTFTAVSPGTYTVSAVKSPLVFTPQTVTVISSPVTAPTLTSTL
jgi:PKD repeat protein